MVAATGRGLPARKSQILWKTRSRWCMWTQETVGQPWCHVALSLGLDFKLMKLLGTEPLRGSDTDMTSMHLHSCNSNSWAERFCCLDAEESFPSTNEKLGHWLTIEWNAGDSLTFRILTSACFECVEMSYTLLTACHACNPTCHRNVWCYMRKINVLG